MEHLTTKVWWILFLRGALGPLLGLEALWLLGSGERYGKEYDISLLIRPEEMFVTLVFLLGLYAFLDGAFSILLGIQDLGGGRRWWVLVGEGLFTIGLGLLVWRSPGLSILVLLYWIAAWAILSGLMEMNQGLRGTEYRDRRPVLFYAGLFSFAFGAVIFWQGMGSERLAWTIALYAVISGIPLLVLGAHLRRFRLASLKRRRRVAFFQKD